jgi:stage V sporulation protein B
LRKTKKASSTFFGGVAILAVGITIVKLIGALYKIPVGNILGEAGMGHFGNAYVIYNLLLMISTAGLPVALSKTIAEDDALGRQNGVRKTFRVALGTFFALGFVSFGVMYYFAAPLASLQGDAEAALAVRALAPACLFVCLMSTFRGYAQGFANMVPTSVSQVIEAGGKLIVGVGLAWYLMNVGSGTVNAAAGAIFGVTVGAGIALVFLIVDYLHSRKTALPDPNNWNDDAPSTRHVLKRLLTIAVPITLGASIVPITTWLDTFQVQHLLRDAIGALPPEYYLAAHLDDPVVKVYGSYQFTMTAFNLPSSFVVALTAAIIPAISACFAGHNTEKAGRIAESSLRVGTLLAFPAGVGLTVIAMPIMRTLFNGANPAVVDPCMQVLGIASIFVCIMFLCNAILQAAGFVHLPIVIMLIGCAAKLLVNNFLVQQPSVGIIGAPVGTLVCYALVAVLELILIRRKLPIPPDYRRVFVKPLLATAVMGAGAWATSGLLCRLLLGNSHFSRALETGGVTLSTLGGAAVTAGSMAVAIALYAVCILLLKAITREDLSLMPKGDKIAKFLRIGD